MRNRRPVPAPAPRDEIAEKIAWLTEGIFQVGPFRFGLDPIIGLLPGAGDLIAMLIGFVIVQRGLALGIPKTAVARMAANLAIDAIVGAIPFLGDAFDFAFKANTKNLAILREAMEGRRHPGRDRAFLAAIVLLLLAAVAVPIVVLYLLVRQFGLL